MLRNTSTFYKYIILLCLLFSQLCLAAPEDNRDNHALVIIDMQPYFATRAGNDQKDKNKIKVLKIINKQIAAIREAKKAKIPIVLIEYEYGSSCCGKTNRKLRNEVKFYKKFKTIKKNTDGMFSSSNKYKQKLTDYLEDNHIGSLIILGANGGACVKQSIKGSLEENYNVIAYNKGIADFNYRDFIYPYKDIYKFKPNCKNCNFKEVDSLATVSLVLATSAENKVKNKVNIDSDTKEKKEPLPLKENEEYNSGSVK